MRAETTKREGISPIVTTIIIIAIAIAVSVALIPWFMKITSPGITLIVENAEGFTDGSRTCYVIARVNTDTNGNLTVLSASNYAVLGSTTITSGNGPKTVKINLSTVYQPSKTVTLIFRLTDPNGNTAEHAVDVTFHAIKT